MNVSAMKCYGLVALVAALVLLVGCTGRPNGVEPVSPFDINRYQGVWYEIMRLEQLKEERASACIVLGPGLKPWTKAKMRDCYTALFRTVCTPSRAEAHAWLRPLPPGIAWNEPVNELL